MGSADKKFELIPTPNPSVMSIRVWLDANQMDRSNIPAIGQTYKSSPIPSKPKVDKFGDYVYTYMDKSGDDIWLYFGQNLTDEQRLTPFRTWTDTRPYTWPAVLEDLYFVKSSLSQYFNTGTAVATAPRLFPRYRYRPATPWNSVIQVQQFLGQVEYPVEFFDHDQPIPTDVNGSYLGVDVSFPRCLHQTIAFPEPADNQVIFGVGMVNPPPNRNPIKMIFPATNFIDWNEFVIEDKQTPVNGMFLRETITIYPPEYQPESIIT